MHLENGTHPPDLHLGNEGKEGIAAEPDRQPMQLQAILQGPQAKFRDTENNELP
jgi:hypothetical protein